MDSEIDLRELKQKIDTLLDGIITQLKVDRITVDPESDYYWDLHDEQMFDTNRELPEIVTGRLTDDLHFLRTMQPTDIVPLMLDHIAPLLRYLAYRLPGFQ
jgi:hypothetical protein